MDILEDIPKKVNGSNRTFYFPDGVNEKLERLRQEICKETGVVHSKSHILTRLIEMYLERYTKKETAG